MYYIYYLRCASGALYAGYTTDPKRRLRQHRGELAGGAKYTASDPPVGYAALWETEQKSDALRLEWQLKHVPGAKKRGIVSGAPLPTEHPERYRRSEQV